MKSIGIVTLFIPLIVILLTNCKEEDESLKLVVVKGRVYDDNRQQPVKNLLVKVFDVECKNFMCHFNEILDSTRTDNQGYYEIKYKPKNGNSIHVACGYKNHKYAHPTSQVREQLIGRGNNTVNFILRETSVLKTRVIVTNNPYPPLRITELMNYYTIKVYGANKDTVVYLHGVPNQNNEIDLSIISPDLSYFKRRIDNIQLGAFADTVDITITADPNTFPLTK